MGDGDGWKLEGVEAGGVAGKAAKEGVVEGGVRGVGIRRACCLAACGVVTTT